MNLAGFPVYSGKPSWIDVPMRKLIIRSNSLEKVP